MLARPLAAILAAVALAGCAPSPAAPPAALPDAVTVSVFQNRFDYSTRTLQLKVSNGSDDAITVTRATFESTRFVEPALWDRPQRIPAAGARDLAVQLPGPVCGGGAPVDTVTLTFTLADGASGTATVTPVDEQGRLDTLNDEDCLIASVSAVAAIIPADTLRWTPGAHAPATLELAVRPTGAEGEVTIVEARGTVLLSLTDGSGAPVTALPVNDVIDASTGETRIPLSLAPNRCDPHAVEEDKRGTFFPLEVGAHDGRSGTIYIAVGDDVRRPLYEFYADYCGLPGA